LDEGLNLAEESRLDTEIGNREEKNREPDKVGDKAEVLYLKRHKLFIDGFL
jgi:hypothetical protein